MKLYFEIIKALYLKYIRKMNTGIVIKNLCEKMGIVYIKFAQMLATQNIGNIFNEEDRQLLSSICDNCKPIEFTQITNMIEMELNMIPAGSGIMDVLCELQDERAVKLFFLCFSESIFLEIRSSQKKIYGI